MVGELAWCIIRRQPWWRLVFGLLAVFGTPSYGSFVSLDLGGLYGGTPYRSGDSLAAFLRFRYGWDLGSDVHFEPSFGVCLPWRGGVDGTHRIVTSHLDLSFGIPLFSTLRLRAGPGVQWVLFWPGGGEVQLDNGTGVSTFYVPSTPASVFLTTIDVGIEWRMLPELSVVFDVILLQLLSDANRRASAALTVGVRL